MIADDQHADLAQHQDADHVDDIDVGAEFAEMENALLRHDGADQERDQQDDRHRAPADAVELVAPSRSSRNVVGRECDAQPRHGDRAEHAERSESASAATSTMLRPTVASANRCSVAGRPSPARQARGAVHRSRPACGTGRAAAARAHVAPPLASRSRRMPLQQPGAVGVEPFDTAHVDVDVADASRRLRRQRHDKRSRPAALSTVQSRGRQFKPFAAAACPRAELPRSHPSVPDARRPHDRPYGPAP